MKLSFLGAARQVTGSMFLLQLEDGYKILIDCGTDMAHRRSESQEEGFPFYPSEIDVVLLTHAHIDHSGKIPLLINAGYKGQILCTSPTYDLTNLLLRDSASLNVKRIMRKQKGKRRFTEEDTQGMFLEKQVEEASEHFVTISFNKRFEIKEGLYVTFIPTGHLLGAANLFIEVTEGDLTKSIAFSGDIGRKSYPLLQDPQPMPQADYLVCESTYGNRSHQTDGIGEKILEETIKESCIDIPGRLIIPAFSVGRTQSILYTLHRLFKTQNIPPVKIFADSPMAEQSSRIYEEYVPLLNEEARKFYSENQSLFDFENLEQIETFKDSKAISDYHEPCIIISSSGMITGGRMQHHIKKNINNPYCTILLVGYAASGTTGFELANGNRLIRINGKEFSVAAKIVKTDVFSGHADREDLIEFVKNQKKLKRIFLVHGEYESMQAFKASLAEEGYHDVELPEQGSTYEL
jgi:metallo-beta-lactamase family protein